MKHIRVALFGVSRSGKNYTIDDFMELAKAHGMEFIHMSPMDMIRARLKGRRLRYMPECEKKELVREVRDEIDLMAEDHNVIVDEHYCYPATFGGKKLENGYYDEKLPHDIFHRPDFRAEYEVVFPRFESLKYDMFATMYIDPNIIVERSRTSKGAKYNPFVTAEEIEEWQRAETEGLELESRMQVVRITDPLASGALLWEAVKEAIDREA
jgi:adenylate kinase